MPERWDVRAARTTWSAPAARTARAAPAAHARNRPWAGLVGRRWARLRREPELPAVPRGRRWHRRRHRHRPRSERPAGVARARPGAPACPRRTQARRESRGTGDTRFPAAPAELLGGRHRRAVDQHRKIGLPSRSAASRAWRRLSSPRPPSAGLIASSQSGRSRRRTPRCAAPVAPARRHTRRDGGRHVDVEDFLAPNASASDS